MSKAKEYLEFANLYRDLSPAQQDAAEKVIGGDYADADPEAAEAAYWMLSIMGEDCIEEAWKAWRDWLEEQGNLVKEEVGMARRKNHGLED